MKLSLLILTTATILSLALTGCKITGQSGDFITISPSRAQLESAAREVVCQSFAPITFSGQGDTSDTVSQVRQHNASYGAYKCGG